MIISAIALSLLLFAAGAPAECLGEWSPHVVWHVAKIGKLTSELQLGPNGLLYALCGNKLIAVDENGNKLWESDLPDGSKSGCPVFDARGSIFIPGNALIQEVKLNGSKGWSFKVYQGSSKAAALLTTGPGNLLYMQLPTGLYAVDTAGHYKWMITQWDQVYNASTQLETDWEILASVGNDQAVFVIIGKKKEGYTLMAFGEGGKIRWRYSLGEIKQANLVVGGNGRVYATVNPKRTDDYYKGTVYAFESDGDGSPLWSYAMGCVDLTAPTPSEDGLLYFCADEKLYALNQDDGTEAWYEPLPKAISRPSVDENNMRYYLGTEDKRLLALNTEGRLDWNLTLDGKVSMRPMVGPDGYLYVVTEAGSIYKIKDEAPESDGG
ncbi:MULTISPECIES: PQQ-binding-like beta-propeller repeat protein [Pelotomaculum]|uniref:PQQ-like beta-propeller repeat protein n=1 Tax=Pelotomaculum isophthalicicum JI TaxID=947010 RepID=A0A9X4JWS6_9FIRM|nr:MULTISPECIES: PQQ-binding-like beta-propeller repeat protein [Pelotomaculum]MDF9409868.1 PQQ-like beta-propeller repeat protein [Pelotomaculum isophthalicicum JI]